MKINTLIHTLAAVVAVGIAFPAMASAKDTNTVSGDEPEVKILFHHTAEKPYDIRLLSWCGGLASRIQIVPKTHKPLVIAYNTGDLHGAKITGREPSRIGFCICKDGKTKTLFDLLCLEKRESPVPNLVTKVSDKSEWRLALDLQTRGILNVKTFAQSSIGGDQYACNPASNMAAR